jgi:hypothetical protein
VLGGGIAAVPQVADPARDGAVILRGHELPSTVSVCRLALRMSSYPAPVRIG